MNTFIVIYCLVLLAVVYLGLRRIYKAVYWRNVLTEEQIKLLNEIKRLLKK